MSERKTVLYRVFDTEGALIYAGISLQFFARLQQHKNYSPWFEKMSSVTVERFETRGEAIAAEAKAIAEENPKMNIMKPRSKEIEKLKKELELELERDYAKKIEDSRRELTEQVVKFKLIYSLDEAAEALHIQRKSLRALVEKGILGTVTLPPKEGIDRWGKPYKPKQAVSGWQIIDYIESLHVLNKGSNDERK
jgi:predicted GIY-YIG superfamily endonuclease